MYKLELVNKKTKEVTIFDDIVDLNYGGKMFFNFEIDARQLADGEYALSLYENGELILTDTLCVGDFDIIGIQYKKGEAIYIETKLEAKIQDKTVEITDINTTILPDEEYDAMATVEVNAQPVYDGAYNVGHTDGVRAQKDKLQSIEITANGVYSKEDGYNNIEVALPIQTDKVADIRKNGTFVITPDDDNLALEQVTVNVEAGKIRIPNGISFAGSTFTDFPVDNYDWSSLGSTILMFADCKNLNAEPIIKALKDGTIPALDTRYMFYGSKVTRIEDIDFTKFYNYQGMFLEITDLKEVRNCVLPKQTGSDYLIRTNSGEKYFRLIDCDCTDKINAEGWYFAKFKNADKLTEIYRSSPYDDSVAVMECDMPSTLKRLSYVHIWYDATKYSGWDSFSYSYLHPYGFYYNVITKDTDTNIMIKSFDEKVDYEQVIPYNEEKGCYYIDYPEYMDFDVYLDGVKLDGFRMKYNVDIYKPSNEPGVYEGSDIKYLIYHTLNSSCEVKEDGLFILKNRDNTVKQRINTPTDQLIITVTAGTTGSTTDFLWVDKNGVSTSYKLSFTDETEHTIDTSDCDYIDVSLYVKDCNNTYIKKIEVL